ncbi:MAG TPA: adenylate/guanylate cyclase domain-containing protein [Polyangia bacterium]|jgi:predicted ATPase/class 3 adenylate cyclase|nr:adenylate/guanylate cyclase domain-containing protein [Polyangia bacterium]
MRCRNCNAEGAEAKFCGECGKPLLGTAAPESLKAERRQLTVLFCDLVGSTALSERLDPEDLREVMQEFQSLCAGVVRRHEGYLAQHLGDGLLIYFGYPVAHEDDARRAVLAGLEMLEAVEKVRAAGEPLQVRVGIHSGLVVVGEIGEGDRKEQLAVGETPNFAHHVQTEARPGCAVISEATERLVRGFFRIEELPQGATLKRVARTLRLFRILEATAATSRIEAAYATGLTPFVGRKEDVAFLADSWALAGNGTRSAVLIRGEPGIGKSRLVEMVKGWIEPGRDDLLDCRCSQYYENSALHPIIEMMERRFGFAATQSADQKRKHLEERVVALGLRPEEAVPLLAPLFAVPVDDHYPTLAAAAPKQRQRTLELLAECLTRLAAQRPTLFILEDLHWADPTTIELLKVILRRQIPNSPTHLMILLSARPEFPPEDLGRIEERNLRPLPRDESKTIIAHLTGQKALPDDLLVQLLTRAGDIPLFVEELTKAILEEGSFRELDDRYQPAGTRSDDDVPAAIRGPLMARIDRLGASKPLAQLAATLGREFRYDVLKAVSSRDDAVLQGDLSRLVDAGLVFRTGSREQAVFTFKHALIQRVAYDMLLRKTRHEYHAQIARTLTERFPYLKDTEPELLARHYEGAGLLDEAISHWQKAGQRALGRADNKEAIAHFENALKLVAALAPGAARDKQELDLQMGIAPAYMAIKGWAALEVERTCRRAGVLGELLGDFNSTYGSRWGLWTNYFLRGKLDEALETGAQVLRLADQTGIPMLQVMAHHAVGYSHFYRGEFLQVREHAEAGLQLFNLEAERNIVRTFQFSSSAALRIMLGSSLWMLGYPDQAPAMVQSGIALTRELKHHPSEAFALAASLLLHACNLDIGGAAKTAADLLTLAKHESFEIWSPFAKMFNGWVLVERGETDKGIAETKLGIAEWQATGSYLNQTITMAMLGLSLWKAGRADEALATLEVETIAAEARQELQFAPELYRLMGEIHLERALIADSEACFERARALARQQNARMLELRATTSLGRVWEQTGRGDAARRLVADLYGSFTEGFATPDLKAARELLNRLGDPEPSFAVPTALVS